MNPKHISVFTAIIAALLIVSPVLARSSALQTDVNPAGIVGGFADGSFWVSLLAALIAGAIGGVGYELLMLQGNIELPHRPAEDDFDQELPYARARNLIDLGIIARFTIGALAGVAILLVLTPETTFELIATALIAGVSGSAVLSAMQERVSAILAEANAKQVMLIANRQDAKVAEALKSMEVLRDRMALAAPAQRTRAIETAGISQDGFEQGLDQVERLLIEARGVHQGIRPN